MVPLFFELRLQFITGLYLRRTLVRFVHPTAVAANECKFIQR